jgi:LacI family transcriptional regulator
MRDAMRELKSSARSRIADIARGAGGGTATVDPVLNDRKGGGRPTAERVLDVARRLNYPLPPPTHGDVGISQPEFRFPAACWPISGRGAGDSRRAVSEVQSNGDSPRHREIQCGSVADNLIRMSNGIAFIALEHSQVREPVNVLVDSRIPVVTMVSDLSNSQRLGYVGIDNRAAGRTAGHLLERFIGQRDGKAAMIAGSLSYRCHEEREMGFQHIL